MRAAQRSDGDRRDGGRLHEAQRRDPDRRASAASRPTANSTSRISSAPSGAVQLHQRRATQNPNATRRDAVSDGGAAPTASIFYQPQRQRAAARRRSTHRWSPSIDGHARRSPRADVTQSQPSATVAAAEAASSPTRIHRQCACRRRRNSAAAGKIAVPALAQRTTAPVFHGLFRAPSQARRRSPPVVSELWGARSGAQVPTRAEPTAVVAPPAVRTRRRRGRPARRPSRFDLFQFLRPEIRARVARLGLSLATAFAARVSHP